MQFLRNLRLAGATATEHLLDDPLVLLLLVSRRLPHGVVQRLVPVLMRVGRATKSPLVLAFAGLLSGDTRAVRSAAGMAGQASARRNRLLAEISLAADLPQVADQLLVAVPSDTARRAGTVARRDWYDGRMSDAEARLSREPRHAASARRLRSELKVFTGWQPSLAGVQDYAPVPSSMLYVLTNSLPHTHSGYAQRSHSVLKALRDSGWTVGAVTRLGYPVQVGKIAASGVDVVDGIRYHRLLPSRLRPGMDQRLQQQAELLLELCLRERPAVLQTTTHFVNAIVVKAVAVALGIPWVYEVRGQLADTWASRRSVKARSSERYRLFTEREAEVSHSADLVVTLGSAMKRRLESQGIGPDDILLYPNAVGDEFLEAPMKPRDARERLGLPQNGTFVGTVSSLVDYEGLDTLLRAIALLVPKHPELHCMIVGDGAAAPSLRLLAAELGIDEQTIFPGRVPRGQAHLYHQALDVFVVPRRDTEVTRVVTPLKPVESMASGRPVIVSDLEALREVVTPGESGLAVLPDDPAALAEAIENYLCTPDLVGQHGSAGRQQVLSSRTWSSGARSLVKAYRKLEVMGA